MSGLIILNPYANRWEAAKQKAPLLKACDELDLGFDCIETKKPLEAIEIARKAASEGISPIIAAGGDGTIGEVLNGLFAFGSAEGSIPFGIIPLGTANDLVTNLGHPKTLQESIQLIKNGKTRRIDVGKVNDWVFANNSAVGLEPIVSQYNIRMTWSRGIIRYLLAALRAIWGKPRWNVKMEWDDGKYEGPVSLVSVGNGPLTGGLFRMAPGAKLDDGALTFVHGYAPTRQKMLTLLPRAISGDYVNDPAIHQHHTTKLRIITEPSSPLQTDGEIRTDAATIFEYEVLPAALEIYAP
ncbi:MAG: diacylglycerol kinase family lipid kinase [Anaerolineales bacterium]|jgi:diacylglycerol kinase (ATP)